MADEVPGIFSTPSSLDGDNAGKTRSPRKISQLHRRSSADFLNRRTSSNSSLRGAFSRNERRLSRTSADIPLPRISENVFYDSGEPAQWHSASLLFVALPAFAGIFFENGSLIMTDVLMLALGCLFLYWSVKWPWQWYVAAQAISIANEDPDADDAIYDEASDEEREDGEPVQKEAESIENMGLQNARNQMKHDAAVKTLQSDENMAFFACFFSPVAVAYLLHTIRPYLSRPSGGIVSNSNLTLFVLAAEVRPFLHLSSLIEARTMRLQRVVTSFPRPVDNKQDQIDALTRRVEEVEARTTLGSPPSSDKDRNVSLDPSIEKNVRQSLQPQLDALNRAVRGYEKRARTQAMVMEARLQDLESRLRDALSLAAAASRNNQQRPGVFLFLLDHLSNLMMAPFEVFAKLVLWPLHLLGESYQFLFGPRRKKRRAKPLLVQDRS
ncbi:hypothetical protein EJ08DRAFT_703439 [Tothia fuscella]|uniref:Uncharacterized protein n=1 Tax=Tothia fuscella TaxID=1048955 RepID=A0A9P4NEK8_9PEZI|nr:hypothetical protein EJ08DRAFT_703439 [Tothia fuscella]